MNATPPAGRPARIHQLIERWVQAQPQQPALCDPHASLSYGELHTLVSGLARTLQDLQVRPGDRVVVVAENCVAAAVLVLACSRIDAWFCVINARLSPREVDGIVAHAGARRVFYTVQASPEAAQHAARHGAQPLDPPVLAGALQVGALQAQARPEPCSESGTQQVAALIYTSGTSGAPKGVMLTHDNMAFAALSVPALRGLNEGDRVYAVLPLAHIVGLSTQLLAGLAFGACVRLEPRFSPERLVQALEDGITMVTGVPAMYARLLEWLRVPGRTLHAPRLRVAGVAGSPLTPALKAEVERMLGVPLLNGYGLTETSPTIAQVRSAAPRQDCAVGPPIAGLQTRIVAGGAPVEPGAVGELWVRGPNVMKGYYRDESLTREAIDAEGWFRTGDMVRQGEDGALHIVGRCKELIIRSGFNVYPLEVEQVLNGYPGVVQSAVVGRSAGDNEEVVAFLEMASPLDEAALRAFLRERLSPYKQPAEIRVLPQLPAAPTGKVLKNVLKTLAAAPAATPTS